MPIDENTAPTPEALDVPAVALVDAEPEPTTPVADQDATKPATPVADLWGSLTARLAGYVKILTNDGLLTVRVSQTDDQEVQERIGTVPVPQPPLKKVRAKGGKKSEEFPDFEDPDFRRAQSDYGMVKTFALIDSALHFPARGKTFLDRCKTYKQLSIATTSQILAGISMLNLQEYTSDMVEDLDRFGALS